MHTIDDPTQSAEPSVEHVLTPGLPAPRAVEVEIVEVCPRDGLQNESRSLSVDDRVELIQRAVAAGVRRIEAVSFVSPKAVPQMAGAEEVMQGLPRVRGVRYAGLVLNMRGLERALACSVDEVNVVVPATNAMCQANQGVEVDQMMELAQGIISECLANGLPVTATVAVAFGCPFEGVVEADLVVELSRRLCDAGATELCLADTIGVGVPSQVRQLSSSIGSSVPLRFHFHNTRNTGYANVLAAVEEGSRAIDASVGGFGGCPFSPGASGNVASEDVDYLMTASGYETGLDRSRLTATASWLGLRLGTSPTALLGRVGAFPFDPKQPNA